MKSYSQCGQDLFVNYLTKGIPGKFLDLGCSLPKKINNTYFLELIGWDGISLDIQDFSKQWLERKCKFLQSDCLNVDYNNLLKDYYTENTIDYLTLDMEGCGDRFKLLQKIIESNYNFKIITIEHDAYMGESFVQNEQIPQRKLLEQKGYKLLCANISHDANPDLYFEDWWINPLYFHEEDIKDLYFKEVNCGKIFEKLNISYEMAEESKDR
jgi:hypothetical protein